MKLYSAQEMTRADDGAQELGIPGTVLMERAGAAMADEIMRRYPVRRFRSLGLGALVVCGGGNNGGDGFVIARELYRSGYSVAVLATKDEYAGDPATNLEILRNLGLEIHGPEMLSELLDGTGLVVDALLGTGFSGEVREKEAGWIRQLNDAGVTTVSVDVPSGVDGSTGEVQGVAVEADLTVCAHAAKIGCIISPGREHAGEVVVVDIGIPPQAKVEPSVEWTDKSSIRGLVPRTGESAHKYSAGALMVISGSKGVTGAPVMAVEGAQRTGCGIVFLATPQSAAPDVDLRLTEALVYGTPEDDSGQMNSDALEQILAQAERATAVVVGPGMGTGDEGTKLVEGILRETDVPVLLDADAITNLAGSNALSEREAPTIITPHPGELSRLMESGTKELQSRRLYSVREAAEKHGCCVLLKGSDTIVADTGRTSVNSTGNVALATAGTGDVLSGVIGALLSRGMEPYNAARAGAWIHGRAAELWLAETKMPAESFVATDLLPFIPQAVGEIL